MQLRRTAPRAPTGFAFEIADLLMVQAWADYHDLRLRIELDAAEGDEEYEEIVSLSQRESAFRRWMMWRSCDGIVVQPMMGRPMLFDAMADALELLIPAAP